MQKFNATSGTEVIINPAPWKDAKALKRALESEFARGTGIDLPTVLLVDSSEAVDAALWPCLARCLRGGEKIVEMTFDAAEARQDYYDIVIACIKENLGPLAESLRSKLKEFGVLNPQAPAEEGPELASTMKMP